MYLYIHAILGLIPYVISGIHDVISGRDELTSGNEYLLLCADGVSLNGNKGLLDGSDPSITRFVSSIKIWGKGSVLFLFIGAINCVTLSSISILASMY